MMLWMKTQSADGLSKPFVLLISEAKDLVGWAEMLSCTQHDKTLPNCGA